MMNFPQLDRTELRGKVTSPLIGARRINALRDLVVALLRPS